jgi:hypothetical protein
MWRLSDLIALARVSSAPAYDRPVDARLVARAVAAGRIGFGAGLVIAPERFTNLWLGRDAARAGTQVVSRGLGARDIALGVGALAADESQLGAWVAGAVMADAADLMATVTAGRSVPVGGRVAVGLLALSGVALGAVALAGLSRGSS